MFLVDTLLNATVYGGLLYLTVSAIIFAVKWTENQIRLQPLQQTTALTRSHTRPAEQATVSAKTHTVTRVETESLMKAAEPGFVAA